MKIKHRGPDRTIFIDSGNYKLGFHRLAIMDTKILGDQPFTFSYTIDDVRKTIYVMCNGEIYNYHEIISSEDFKETLKLTSYIMKSNSDCEILLPLFIRYGMEHVLKMIRGEFAISILEISETETSKNYNLYLGRDRFGIRPLFFFQEENSLGFCSEMKGLIDLTNENIKVFPPRSFLTLSQSSNSDNMIVDFKSYYDISSDLIDFGDEISLETIKTMIRKQFKKSVKSMLCSDRELGCLLSGGLDSSLVSSIASKYLQKRGKKLKTFSIGMPNSPDALYAKMVADHIGSDHTNIVIEDSEWLKSLKKVIYITETYDITTIRATTGQYLISKWISENTNIKVLLIGDGSDELTSGYLYFHKAPSPEDSHNENVRLLTDIHYYDVLRADRGIASNGLEARVPFLDYDFVKLYLSLDKNLRQPQEEIIEGKPVKCEKWLLRKSFEDSNLLPKKVLWRKKEAFSDGVSSTVKSWYEIIQERINLEISESYFNKNIKKYNGYLVPHTKEALYYHEIFDSFFPKQYSILNYYWLPKWIPGITDPSARILSIYK